MDFFHKQAHKVSPFNVLFNFKLLDTYANETATNPEKTRLQSLKSSAKMKESWLICEPSRRFSSWV